MEPGNDDGTNVRKRKNWLRVLKWSITGILVPPLVGMSITVLDMIRSFNAASLEGGTDPGSLSRNIGLSLQITAVGLCISTVFLVLFLVALVRYIQLAERK